MPPEQDSAQEGARVCQWLNESDAFKHFANYTGGTQSQQHIKPLHWYVACRLVIEGGFRPEELTPRPPFVAKRSGSEWIYRTTRESRRVKKRLFRRFEDEEC